MNTVIDTPSRIKKLSGPKLNIKHGCIELSHGSGGRAMRIAS